MPSRHKGTTMESFLEEEGLLEEVELRLEKKIFVDTLLRLMEKRKISPSELARRMKTSRTQIDRLLDPDDAGVTLRTVDKASKVLDASFHLMFEENKHGAAAKRGKPTATRKRIAS